MGMYTELIFGARLTETLPKEVIDILTYMVKEPFENRNTEINCPPKPSHPFFTSDRWAYLFHMGSYYFGVNHGLVDFRKDSQGEYILSSRSNLKNYDQEIEKFLDWIKPYITAGSGSKEFYAIVCYEEQAEPTIHYMYEEEQ